MSSTNDPAVTPLDDLTKQAQEALLKASDHISEHAFQLRNFASDIRYNTEDFIQTNPWKAVAIAAGIGFVVGALAARRR